MRSSFIREFSSLVSDIYVFSRNSRWGGAGARRAKPNDAIVVTRIDSWRR